VSLVLVFIKHIIGPFKDVELQISPLQRKEMKLKFKLVKICRIKKRPTQSFPLEHVLYEYAKWPGKMNQNGAQFKFCLGFEGNSSIPMPLT